jgi:hypothetical protein
MFGLKFLACLKFRKPLTELCFAIILFFLISYNAKGQDNLILVSDSLGVDTTQIDTIYSFAEEMPQYPGGEAAMMDFLRKNIVFPESINDTKMQDATTTYIEYVVEKDGQVSNVKPLKKSNSGIAKEYVRVVKTFPNHSPGKIDGKPVRVRMMVPFKIDLK